MKCRIVIRSSTRAELQYIDASRRWVILRDGVHKTVEAALEHARTLALDSPGIDGVPVLTDPFGARGGFTRRE